MKHPACPLAVILASGLGFFFCALLPHSAVSQGDAEADETAAKKKIRALLVTGGCCHDYKLQKTILPAGINERVGLDIDWTVVHQGGTTTDTAIPLYEDPDWAEGYDVVVHNECFAKVDDADFVEGILAPHREGLPAVLIHCAMHCYRTGNDDWFEFCGVTSRRHGPKHPFPVDFVEENADHPVLEGLSPWKTPQGELYFIEKVWDSATPLARSKSEETGETHVNVWTNTYGEKETRVFGTTIGHHNETMMDPPYLDMLTRGFLWSLDRLEDGGFRKVAAEDSLRAFKKAREEKSTIRLGNHLARGKDVAASSGESAEDHPAARAVDGDPATGWRAAEPGPAWWQLDLGEPARIRALAIHWEAKDAAHRYTVEGSKTGAEWTVLADASGNDVPAEVNFHEPDAKQIRHLRVNLLGSGTDTGAWGGIREFAAYGSDKQIPGRIAELASSAAAAGEKGPRTESNGKSTTVKTPLVPAGKDGLLRTLRLPEGYAATIFARPPEVNYPTFVKATPEGELFVSVDKNGSLDREPGRGKIVAVTDSDGDGVGDRFTDFVPEIDSPRGLEWDGEWLYVMHPPHLSAFRDADGDGIAEEERRLVSGIAFGFDDRPADHTSNGVTLGADGWLHLAIGDFGFLGAEGADGIRLQLRGGGVVRVRRDGSGLHVFARGTRNIYEVALSPRLDGFARDNTNDGGGWDTRFHHFTGLEHHGYPSLYRNFPEDAVAPLADYGGGSGTGALWLAEPGFPESETDASFTADWGRNLVYRHEIERRGATFAEKRQHEFLAAPRPTDLDADARGALYLASWKDGRFKYDGEEIGYVAAITPPGWKPRPVPDFSVAGPTELLDLLRDESHLVRLHAQLELLRRPALSSQPALIQALSEMALAPEESLETRTLALYALVQALGGAEGEKEGSLLDTLAALAESDEAPARVLAFRALGDLAAGKDHSAFAALAEESDPLVLKEMIVALARTRTDEAAYLMDLIAKVDHEDPLVAHTAMRALETLEASHVCFLVLDDKEREPLWPGAMRALSRMHRPEVVKGIVQRLEESRYAGIKSHGLAALARLYHREGEWTGESWGTRPDTSGPVYQRETWEGTELADRTLREALRDRRVDKAVLLAEMERNHIELDDLPELLRLVEDDPAIEPAVVDAVLERETTPSEALPFLTRIARSEIRDGELRLRAAAALARANQDAAVDTALEIDRTRSSIDAIPHARKTLHQAVLASPVLENRYASLLAAATGSDTAAGRQAWEILFALHGRKKLAPETKEQIEHAVAAMDKKGREQQLRFLGLVAEQRFAPAADVVLALRESTDDAVKSAAGKAAARLGLGDSAPEGQLIAGMKKGKVLAAVAEAEGDPGEGEALFARQTCAVCHTVSPDEPLKGPYLGNITNLYRGRELAEAVLDPGKTVAQGFATHLITLEDGTALTGFVTSEGADKVELRDIAGNVTEIDPDDIAERTESPASMMPPGLVNNLTVEQFASLLAYLESLGE